MRYGDGGEGEQCILANITIGVEGHTIAAPFTYGRAVHCLYTHSRLKPVHPIASTFMHSTMHIHSRMHTCAGVESALDAREAQMAESWGQLAANAAALKAGDLDGLSSRATVRQAVQGGGTLSPEALPWVLI